MSYIDGFVVPVPFAKKDAYREMAQKAAALFKEHGALRVVECWGDDVPEGTITDFRRSVKSDAQENIVFSWIEWPSKEARDEANERMKTDSRMKIPDDLPFDGSRMIFGGFEVLVDAKAEKA